MLFTIFSSGDIKCHTIKSIIPLGLIEKYATPEYAIILHCTKLFYLKKSFCVVIYEGTTMYFQGGLYK